MKSIEEIKDRVYKDTARRIEETMKLITEDIEDRILDGADYLELPKDKIYRIDMVTVTAKLIAAGYKVEHAEVRSWLSSDKKVPGLLIRWREGE